MFTAFTIDNKKVEPYYQAICFCDNCGSRVYPKCVTPGKEYKVHKHFSHPIGAICDDWFEPVSDWHHDWQSCVPIEQREVSIEHGTVRHIADVYLPVPNIVVELQKSSIPYDVKRKRDAFYNHIFWMVHKNLSLSSWVVTPTKPTFIDMLDGFIKTPIGTQITKEQFIKEILLNPDLKYEDWSFGFDGDIINTRFGKKQLSDIIDGEHLVFISAGGFTSQCLECRNTQHQHDELNQLIDINDSPHFQCSFCGRLYAAYIVKYDPRGDDERLEIIEFKHTLNPYGNATKALWAKHKEMKLRSGI